MAELLWQPTPERVGRTQLKAFIDFVNRRHELGLTDYEPLHAWSVAQPRDFWAAVWDFCDIIHSRSYDRVVDDATRMPGARWFEGAELSFAENLLRYRDEQPALICHAEGRPARTWTYAQLYREVAGLAAALHSLGVGPGDRVAGFLPNIPEAVAAMLATASLGGIWSSCSPDFGADGVLDRFGQIGPKVLLTADGYRYNGKTHDSLEVVADLQAHLSTLERTLVVPFVQPAPDLTALSNAQTLTEFVSPHEGADLEFTQLPFDHPLYILYSSGTTGVPKCIVHGAGGTLLQHMKELVLHTDLRREDRIFYFTTCGWMMWNWLVSALAVGAGAVLYDGSPFHPNNEFVFDLVEQEQVTVFGNSAKFLAATEKAGLKPRETHDLSAVRTVLSTGSVLSVESFRYVYRDIKPDVCLSSISGGTDIISCFAAGNPMGPVYAGELQCRGLGMKVEAFDAEGKSVVGQKGELVCTMAAPSMPIGFWNDDSGERYRKAYFERYPGVWAHGDYVELTANGGVIVYGRSDATLNPGGVRIGTAEIYRQVEKLDEIVDSIVIGQDWQSDVRVVLFVKLKEGIQLDENLVDRIRLGIRENATPRHVPARILAVQDIPYTISGKKVELAVRQMVHGEPVKNRDALANPEALENFANRTELET